jgi:hypothetical protein
MILIEIAKPNQNQHYPGTICWPTMASQVSIVGKDWHPDSNYQQEKLIFSWFQNVILGGRFFQYLVVWCQTLIQPC